MVAHILRTFGNEVELVDVSDQLPGLKRSPGISTWKVCLHFRALSRRRDVERLNRMK